MSGTWIAYDVVVTWRLANGALIGDKSVRTRVGDGYNMDLRCAILPDPTLTTHLQRKRRHSRHHDLVTHVQGYFTAGVGIPHPGRHWLGTPPEPGRRLLMSRKERMRCADPSAKMLYAVLSQRA